MCAAALRVVGSLETKFLSMSLEEVIRRHESLRTQIVRSDGLINQIIHASVESPLRIVDLTNASRRQIDENAKRLSEEFLDKSIDLTVDRMFEVLMLRLSEREHVVILALDHMVADAASCAILCKEIWTLYGQAAAAQPFSLPCLPIQYADYAVWLQQTYDSWRAKHQAYWMDRLAGASRVEIPRDSDRQESNCRTGELLHLPFGKNLSARLRELARNEGTLLPLVVLAVYSVAMSQWCNCGDLVVMFVTHGRHGRPELRNMIGFLASCLHLRLKIQKEVSFASLLLQVNQEFCNASAHDDFGRVQELFAECTDIAFNWLPSDWTHKTYDRHDENVNERLTLHPFPVRFVRPNKFMPFFSDSAAGLSLTIRYRPDILTRGAVERFGESLHIMAGEFASSPRTPLERLSSVSV